MLSFEASGMGMDSDEEKNFFDYELNCRDNRVTISYSLKRQTTVHAIVADVNGMAMLTCHEREEAGEDHEMTIDCSKLRRGHYVVYIYVEGKTYNNKIEIR